MSQKGCCDCLSASNQITQLLVFLYFIIRFIKSQYYLPLNIVLAWKQKSFQDPFLFHFLSLQSFSPLFFSLQLVKLCIGMIDAGKAYNAANKQFVSGIRELAQQSTKDEVIEVNKYIVVTFQYIITRTVSGGICRASSNLIPLQICCC